MNILKSIVVIPVLAVGIVSILFVYWMFDSEEYYL